MIKSEFSRVLRDARLSARLTQEQLSEHSGISVRQIQSLEGGEHGPTLDTVIMLSIGLGIAPSKLVDPVWTAVKNHSPTNLK